MRRFLSFTKLPALLGIALVAASCTFTHTSTTLTVVDEDEFTGDDPFVSVLEYSVVPGTAASATVSWLGGTGSIANNVSEGAVLSIPTGVGQSTFETDFSHCESVAGGALPKVFGQIVVAFEDDFSSQQTAFMTDAATELESALGTFESMTFADLDDCAGVVATIAGGLSAITGMQGWVSSEWPDYDEGFFTDDDDLVGTGVTAYVLATTAPGGFDAFVVSDFGAALSGADQAGGIANDYLSDGRTDTLSITGSGSTYEIAIVLDNVDL